MPFNGQNQLYLTAAITAPMTYKGKKGEITTMEKHLGRGAQRFQLPPGCVAQFKDHVYFVRLVTEKVVFASESLFRPANGVWSTCSQVEIHNIPYSSRTDSFKITSRYGRIQLKLHLKYRHLFCNVNFFAQGAIIPTTMSSKCCMLLTLSANTWLFY